eukprot:TRINITY_DN22356_c0_g1_i1.p1 TRINITY_DN22356_c0_g1~~TRINITY_DN22356_c0_g1_i1.p1  ORF type:complete len:111 (+),score=2.35 TRINITY_DN22356_c0_g1_i1:158-490(+)
MINSQLRWNERIAHMTPVRPASRRLMLRQLHFTLLRTPAKLGLSLLESADHGGRTKNHQSRRWEGEEQPRPESWSAPLSLSSTVSGTSLGTLLTIIGMELNTDHMQSFKI